MKRTKQLMIACASVIGIAAGCQADIIGVDGDGGGAGGRGASTTAQQGGSTTKSSSHAAVSTTDVSTTSGDMCSLDASAQTGGPSPYYCFALTTPCPTQDAAECYLNRYCESGEAGLDVIGGPTSSIPTAVASSSSTGSIPNPLCCYLTTGERCYPTGSSTGGSVVPSSSTGG